MKKIIVIIAAICAATNISNVFANRHSKIIGPDLCVQAHNWKLSKHFHFNAVLYCKKIKCTLINSSGGVVNKNFWEKIDWTFLKSGTAIATGQCNAYPMNPACDSGTPHHTCAVLYLQHVIHAGEKKTSRFR